MLDGILEEILVSAFDDDFHNLFDSMLDGMLNDTFDSELEIGLIACCKEELKII